jgi:hypothetical protein
MVSIIYVLDYYYYRPDGEKIFTSGFFIQTKNGELDFVCCVIKTGAVCVVCKQRIPSSTLFRHAQLTERFEYMFWLNCLYVCLSFFFSL